MFCHAMRRTAHRPIHSDDSAHVCLSSIVRSDIRTRHQRSTRRGAREGRCQVKARVAVRFLLFLVESSLTIPFSADDNNKREQGRNATAANISAAKVRIHRQLMSSGLCPSSRPSMRTQSVHLYRVRSSSLMPARRFELMNLRENICAGCGGHHPHDPRAALHVENAP